MKEKFQMLLILNISTLARSVCFYNFSKQEPILNQNLKALIKDFKVKNKTSEQIMNQQF